MKTNTKTFTARAQLLTDAAQLSAVIPSTVNQAVFNEVLNTLDTSDFTASERRLIKDIQKAPDIHNASALLNQ